MTPVCRPSQVHPTYVRLLRMLLSARALDADAVLAEAGLRWDQVSVQDQTLDYAQVERALAAALKAAGRPWIGLELGAAMQLASHGAVGRATMASRDLRQALHVVARFGRLRVDLFRWEFLPTPGGAVLRISEDHPLGLARQVVLEALFAALLKLVEAVAGLCPEGLQAELPFAEPPWRDRLAACGTSLLRFDRPVLALQFSEAALDLPGLGADPVAFQTAWRECEQALARTEDASLSAQVAALLGGVGDQAHQANFPGLAELAARLHVSPRTLMRRLRAEGCSYQQLLDEERQRRALWMLRSTRQPVEEIAARLGYADTSNFSRTVRRWFGLTPKALRAGSGPDNAD